MHTPESLSNPSGVEIRLIAGDKSWIDGESIRQLESVAQLPGMRLAVGLPDLHQGRGIPIGAAFVSSMIYPHLVGNDIGCGIGVWATSTPVRRFKPEKALKKLDLERGVNDNPLGFDTGFETSLGTIGRGNHFAEFQRIVDVLDAEAWDELGLQRDNLVLTVHSGSRGFGESILGAHVAKHGTSGLTSEDATSYIRQHDLAVAWAKVNRELIAQRMGDQLAIDTHNVLDVTHNSATPTVGGLWVHRKGAAPSDQGFALIPGSRGTASYLVKPVGDQSANAWSLAHGAGRKWSRKDARDRLGGKVQLSSMRRTQVGSFVVCDDRALLYEEAPQAYKDIDVVIGDLVGAGLVRVVAKLHPVLTYKMKAQDDQ